MPIDDELSKLPDRKGSVEETKTKEQVSGVEDYTSVTSVLRTYPRAVYELLSEREKKKRPFSSEVIGNVAGLMRFKSNLGVSFGKIPRDRVLAVLGSFNPDLQKLLAETDLKEAVHDPFSLDDKSHYDSFPISIHEELEIPYRDIYNFEYHTDRKFVIPNLGFMSLFIKRGEGLRIYAGLRRNVEEPIFRKKTSRFLENPQLELNSSFQPFDVETLKEFYTINGGELVGAMTEQTNGLVRRLEERFHDSSHSIRKWKNITEMLAERLGKNYPELYVGGN